MNLYLINSALPIPTEAKNANYRICIVQLKAAMLLFDEQFFVFSFVFFSAHLLSLTENIFVTNFGNIYTPKIYRQTLFLNLMINTSFENQ